MPAVEVWGAGVRECVVALDEPLYVVGSDPESTHITLDDPQVSRVHAALDSIGSVWFVRDLGSRNGTFLNRERVTSQHRLRHNDSIGIGQIQLRYLDGEELVRHRTTPINNSRPHWTHTEWEVLKKLCAPILSFNIIREPAEVSEIAALMHIGRNAVQAHLTNMYDKAGLHKQDGLSRRKLLAAMAIERGWFGRGDLDEP